MKRKKPTMQNIIGLEELSTERQFGIESRVFTYLKYKNNLNV